MKRNCLLCRGMLLLVVALCGFVTRPAWGTPKHVEPEVMIDSMLRTYRFEVAIELIEETMEEINNERNKKKKKRRMVAEMPGLEQRLQYAHKGASMLRATERVVFVDSLVIGKAQLLSCIAIDKESGSIGHLQTLLPQLAERLGDAAGATYVNELGDKTVFAMAGDNTISRLYASERIGDRWERPRLIQGLTGEAQDFPFVLADGITLYYAAKTNEGLGGYDIYMTQYDANGGKFLSSENLGMPYNSPDNDYFCIVDEARNLGWLATDRRQHADSVCVYTFLPSYQRETYNPVLVGNEALRGYAQIMWLKDAQADLDTRKRMGLHMTTLAGNAHLPDENGLTYVVDNELVYPHPAYFQSEAARNYALEWQKAEKEFKELRTTIEEKRNELTRHHDEQLKKEIVEMEKRLLQQKAYIDDLAKKMRQAEKEFLQN